MHTHIHTRARARAHAQRERHTHSVKAQNPQIYITRAPVDWQLVCGHGIQLRRANEARRACAWTHKLRHLAHNRFLILTSLITLCIQCTVRTVDRPGTVIKLNSADRTVVIFNFIYKSLTFYFIIKYIKIRCDCYFTSTSIHCCIYKKFKYKFVISLQHKNETIHNVYIRLVEGRPQLGSDS